MSGPHSVFFLAAVSLKTPLLSTSDSSSPCATSLSPLSGPSHPSCLTGKSGFTTTRFIGSCEINRANSKSPLESGGLRSRHNGEGAWAPWSVVAVRGVVCVVACLFANGTTLGSVQTQERLVKAPRSCGVTCTVYRHKGGEKKCKEWVSISHHSCRKTID